MKKILLIDDSKTQLLSLKIFFSKNNLEVVTAENGIDGYKLLIESPPDIVICDVVMQNLTGYQFARLLKNNPLTQKIPIILLTSLKQNIDKFWGKQAGAELFISKNCEADDLLQAVNTILEKHPVDEGIKKTIANTQILKNALQTKVNNVLDNSLMEATIMNEFRKLAKNIDDSEEFLVSFFKLISSLFNYDICAIQFYDSKYTENPKIYYSSEKFDYSQEVIKTILSKNYNTQYNTEIKSIDIENNTKQLNTNVNLSNNYNFELELNDIKLAKFSLFSYEYEDYSSFQFLDIVKNELALLAKIRNLYAQTKFLSITDDLTGLYNRRYFYESISREFRRSIRYKSDLSVAILDIDFFKTINDNYGHLTGDKILKHLSQTLIDMLRKTDIVFRYGGEEFVVLLPETNKEQALYPFERIRNAIQNSCVYLGEKEIKYTASIGITDITDNPKDCNEFVEFADKALYKAKNSGRNKVLLYE